MSAGDHPNGEPHLTVEDVARWLAVPVSWVYAHAGDGSEGSLPSYRVGRYRRFSAAEVEEWLTRQRPVRSGPRSGRNTEVPG